MNKQFSQDDLLTADELELIITSIFNEDKAELIARKVPNHFFIHKKSLYRLQSNDTYLKMDGDMTDNLTVIVCNYLTMSAKALPDVVQQNLNLKYKKDFVSTFSNGKVSTYVLQIKAYFTKPNIELDDTINEIHFNNGYMDLKDKKFKQRDLTKHFITQYIKRDYKKPSKKATKKIMSDVQKIIPIKEDLEAVLMCIGSALTGESGRDQTCLFILGMGSAGKSLFMMLTKAVIDCYFLELKSDAFSVNNKNQDKTLNSYSSNKCIRVSWINEPDDKQIDKSMFKKFVEGVLQTNKLYKEGNHDFPHYSKLFGTANTMPIIPIDSGTERRIQGYTTMSEFTDDKNKVDESKHIYLKDSNMIENFKKDEDLMNAWFDILVSYAHRWTNGEKIVYSENFKDTKSSIVSTNDTTQDFIDATLILTNEDKDRIGKTEMMALFKEMYPQKFINQQQLLGDLKNHHVKYDPKKRCNNIQGCYVGVKQRTNFDDEKENPLENGIKESSQAVDITKEYNKMKAENEALLKRIAFIENELARKHDLLAELEAQINDQVEVKPKKKATKKKKQVIEVNIDDDKDEFDDMDF